MLRQVKFFLMVCLVMLRPASGLLAAEEHVLQDLATTTVDAQGKEQHSISLEVVDYFLKRIAEHAKDYPPKFDSEEQRRTIEHELQSVILALAVVVQQQPLVPDPLLRLGYAWSMAYNLDAPGSAEETSHCFQQLLAVYPDHPQGNFYYGAFLAHTKTGQRASIPYLEKAVTMGVDDALFTLGFVHLSLEDKDQAMTYWRQYLSKHPDNTLVQAMLESAQSGKMTRAVE